MLPVPTSYMFVKERMAAPSLLHVSYRASKDVDLEGCAVLLSCEDVGHNPRDYIIIYISSLIESE